MQFYEKFISLGLNCEISFQLRRLQGGDIDSYIFSWADLRSMGALLDCLRQGPAIFEAPMTPLTIDMLHLARHKVSFHGKTKLEDMLLPDGTYDPQKLELSRREIISRHTYLFSKFNTVMDSGKSILFLLKPRPEFDSCDPGYVRQSAIDVRDLLRKQHPNSVFDVLVLQEQKYQEPNWSLENIQNRYLAHFAPNSTSWDADIPSWDAIFNEFKLFGASQDIRNAIGDVWSRSALARPQKRRFWDSPSIVRYHNAKLCGEECDVSRTGLIRRIRKRMPGRVFGRGLSIGCGAAHKEMELLTANLVQHFNLFEFSEVRQQQGQQLAAKRELTERLTWSQEDFLTAAHAGPYDFIYFDSSLHHCFKMDETVAFIASLLAEDGLFCCFEYIGPDRFQYDDATLVAATAIRSMLPDRYFLSKNTVPLGRRCLRPDKASLIAHDPSESAESSRIIPALRKVFSFRDECFLGGIVSFIALNDVIGNFDETDPTDTEQLRQLLCMEDALSALGHNLLVTVLARKTPWPAG